MRGLAAGIPLRLPKVSKRESMLVRSVAVQVTGRNLKLKNT